MPLNRKLILESSKLPRFISVGKAAKAKSLQPANLQNSKPFTLGNPTFKMENTNKGRRANCDLVKAAKNENLCDDWPLAFGRGNKGEGWGICTSTPMIHGMPDEIGSPQEKAELVAHLLNLHYRGMLFFVNPDQLKLFE